MDSLVSVPYLHPQCGGGTQVEHQTITPAPFSAELYSISYHIVLISSLAEGHLVCFHTNMIINKVCERSCTSFEWICFPFPWEKDLHVELLGLVVTTHLNP